MKLYMGHGGKFYIFSNSAPNRREWSVSCSGNIYSWYLVGRREE